MLCWFCFFSASPLALAQESITFDFDDPPETTRPITDSLSFGVTLDALGSFSNNLDLDRGRGDKQTVFEPNTNLAFTFEPNETLRAYLDLEFSRREVGGSSDRGSSDRTSLEILEAYVALRDITEGSSLRIGRQLFEDPLEWYLDQELDALRGYHRFHSLAFEAAIGKQGLFDEDLLNGDDTKDVVDYLLVGRFRPEEDLNVSGYLLHRDARAPTGARDPKPPVRGSVEPALARRGPLAHIYGARPRLCFLLFKNR